MRGQCRVAMKFYLSDTTLILNQGGKQVELRPNDVKLSYEVTGCTSFQVAASLMPSQWDPRNVSVIGRSGGPAIEFFGVTDNPLGIIDYQEVDGLDSLNTSSATIAWNETCTSNFTGTGPVTSVPADFNFTKEILLPFKASDFGYDYKVSWRFLRWALSDNSIFTIPSIPFNLNGLLNPEFLGNGTARWKIRFSLRSEFHTNVFYDPSFSVVTLFDLSAGEQPVGGNSTVLTTPAENTAVLIGAAVGGSLAAIAVIVIVAVMFLVPSIRRKILPYSQARSRESVSATRNTLDEDYSAPVSTPAPSEPAKPKPSKDQAGWNAGSTRRATLSNV
jgi:hypothetical protein